jgi:membrane protein required for colicin V production
MVSYLDLILLIPLVLAIWKGWKNGFVMEVFSMLALFVGYLCRHTFKRLDRVLSARQDGHAVRKLTDHFLCDCIYSGTRRVVFSRKLITKSVSAAAQKGGIRLVVHFFSLTKTLLFLSVVFVLFNALDRKYSWLPNQQKDKSYFYEPIYNFSLFLLPSVENSDFYKKLEEQNLAPIDVAKEILPEKKAIKKTAEK